MDKILKWIKSAIDWICANKSDCPDNNKFEVTGSALSYAISDKFLDQIRSGKDDPKSWSLAFADSFYDLFMSQSKNLNILVDRNGYFVLVNDAWTDALGWTKEELTSMPFINLVHPDDIEKTINIYATMNKQVGGFNTFFKNRYRTKSGKYKTLLWDPRVMIQKQQNNFFIGTAYVSKEDEQN